MANSDGASAARKDSQGILTRRTFHPEIIAEKLSAS
jgi:hypothetical protein